MSDEWGMPDSRLNNQFKAVGRALNWSSFQHWWRHLPEMLGDYTEGCSICCDVWHPSCLLWLGCGVWKCYEKERPSLVCGCTLTCFHTWRMYSPIASASWKTMRQKNSLKEYTQLLDTNLDCFCQCSWHCYSYQIWLQKNVVLVWRTHWSTFRQMTFFSLSQAKDLCEADGERKSPIGPLQACGIWGWLYRKTDSWKKIMLLMKKNVQNMWCLLIWEAVSRSSLDLAEGCTDCKSMWWC